MTESANDSPMDTDFSYCRDLVRRYDRDRYICTLLAPEHNRGALFALYAFNIEIAGTRESVSDPLIGQMRLKWWYDALDPIFDGNPPAHQVSAPLSVAVRDTGIDRELLKSLIEARTDDLGDEPPATLANLVNYADGTSGSLVKIACGLLGADNEAVMKAAHHVGIAWAFTGLLRSLPFNLSQRRLNIPTDLCKELDLDVSALFEQRGHGKTPDQLTQAVAVLEAHAREHLAAAQTFQADIPRSVLPAMLPAVLAKSYLKELANCNHDPFLLPLGRTGPGVGGMMSLLWASVRGRF